MKKILACLLLGCGMAANAAHPQPPKFRLGDAALPLGYEAQLAIDPESPTFSGEIRIRMRFNRAVPVLWLNGSGLEIESARFEQGERRIEARVVPGGEDFVGFAATGGEFATGDALATIRYRGRIDPVATRGIFRQQEGGDWYVVSQFEAMSARRAYPCFDEPGWKTPWQLTIDAPARNVVVSNTQETPAFDVPDHPGWKRHAFAATKPLPSYLVALAVGPFDVVEGGVAGERRTPLRYFAPRGRGSEMRWAKESTPRLLEILEGYFGSPHPFEKLDTVMIPATVDFGAMENAGMITYASNIVLAKPHEETMAFKRRYAAIAAHEIAHQWFGNLVTLAWWDDTWLNEAFASWAGRKTLAAFRPEWDEGWQVGEARRRALMSDRLDTARRVRNPVEVKDGVFDAFDRITYDKGSGVLAMFEAWLGPERFRQGVRDYLGAHAFGNATSSDFFAALGAASGRPQSARAAFEAFIEQPGVPMIDVALRCEGGVRGATASLEVLQQRLRPKGSGAAQAEWTTPACFTYRAEGVVRTQCEEIGSGRRLVALVGARSCPDWVLGNAGGAGHYVTRYTAASLRGIAARARQLPEAEAVALAGDTTLLALSGLMPFDDALTLARALMKHRSPGVRQGAVFLLDKARDEFLSDSQLKSKRSIVVESLQPLARQLGWRERADETDGARDLRVALLAFAARSPGGAALQEEARELALRWIRDREAIDAMMVQPVLETAARFADEDTFGKMEAALAATQDRLQRSQLLRALAKVRATPLRDKAYRLALKTDVDGREAWIFLEEALKDEFNRSAAFEFVRAQFDMLAAKLPVDTPGQIPNALGDLCTRAERSAFVAFFEPRAARFSGGPRHYRQAAESIDLCIAR